MTTTSLPRIGEMETLLASHRDARDQSDGSQIQLVYAGDIMLADLPGDAIAGGADPFAEFAEILSTADAAIGNLECVVAACGEAVDKPWTFRAHPRVLPVLARHFDAVSLANNHTGDFG